MNPLMAMDCIACAVMPIRVAGPAPCILSSAEAGALFGSAAKQCGRGRIHLARYDDLEGSAIDSEMRRAICEATDAWRKLAEDDCDGELA
jgi:hypothetical protein